MNSEPTSYPFLALARVRNLRYIDVLTWADLCEPVYRADLHIEQVYAAHRGLDLESKKLILRIVNGERLQLPKII